LVATTEEARRRGWVEKSGRIRMGNGRSGHVREYVENVHFQSAIGAAWDERISTSGREKPRTTRGLNLLWGAQSSSAKYSNRVSTTIIPQRRSMRQVSIRGSQESQRRKSEKGSRGTSCLRRRERGNDENGEDPLPSRNKLRKGSRK